MCHRHDNIVKLSCCVMHMLIVQVHLVVSVGHVVPAGAEPLEQEDGPGGGLDQSEVSTGVT